MERVLCIRSLDVRIKRDLLNRNFDTGIGPQLINMGSVSPSFNADINRITHLSIHNAPGSTVLTARSARVVGYRLYSL